MREIPVTFESEGQQVVGMWHAPAVGDKPAPALILCHGYTGNKAENHRIFVAAARAFATEGFGVLRFDFRGSGDSAGESQDMTISAEVLDARAALAYVRNRPDVDAARVALLGLSLGGTVTALTAAREPALRQVILWNPVADVMAVAERRRTPTSAQELSTRGMANYNGWAVGAPFLQELPTLRPVDALAAADVSTLIVLGDQDQAVPNEDGRAYERALRAAGRPVEVRVVEGADHTFATLEHKQAAIEITLTWCCAHL